MSVVARESGGFALRVTEANRTVAERTLPPENESVTVRDLRIERRNDTLYAVADGTRVRVAEKETYR